MESLDFNQKVVVITDATTSFAQNCSAVFGSRGAKLVLNYPPSLGSARSVSSRNYMVIETHQEIKDAERIVSEAIERLGIVHVLINNASFRSPGASYDLQSSTAWNCMRDLVIDGAYKVIYFPLTGRICP